MKKIIFAFFLTFLVIISSYFCLWLASLGGYQPAEHWLKTVYEIKEYNSKKISNRKIIVLSGSNSLFGVNSKVLSEKTGMDVINLSGHAGLTFNFLAEKAVRNARANDIVLMPLEYGFYSESSSLSKWQVDNMQSWGHEHIKSFSFWETIRYSRHSDFQGIISRLTAQEAIPLDPIENALEYNAKTKNVPIIQWRGYSYKSMNYYGDILADEKATKDVLNTNQDYLLTGKVSPYFLKQAKLLDFRLKQKGAKLYFTWPVSVKNTGLDFNVRSHLQRANALKKKINISGLSFICKPEKFNFSPEMFFNTYYHLNYKGALLRTLELSKCLNDERVISTAKATQDEELLGMVDTLYKESLRISIVSKHMEQRIADLNNIKDALRNYYRDHGSYPRSEKWDGIYSAWGKSSEDWIPDLQPRYIKYLPRDPRLETNGQNQYLYRSDGLDFKLIANGTNSDCAGIKVYYPDTLDPKRGCWAFGFWTQGATNW